MATAEPRVAEEPPPCVSYRAKRDGVPVYRQADKASGVLRTLALGEEVCYLGEEKGFAILDWQAFSHSSDTAPETATTSKLPLAFAALSDLWPPKDSERMDLIDNLRAFLSGYVPDDVFGYLRALQYRVRGGPQCLAGKKKKKLPAERSEDGK